jgi:formyl-CoA transferase
VLELGSIVAGPLAGCLLAVCRADVIKVESQRRPDPPRDWGQEAYRGYQLWWMIQARNKRCIGLQLDEAADRDVGLSLVETAEVVIENFRPGRPESCWLGYEQLCERQPQLILPHISGFARTGPCRHRPGYASIAETMGGLRYINGCPGEAPPRMAVSLGDSLAGMSAVQGVLTAGYYRERTGEGQVVDVALTEACLALMESAIPEYDRLAWIRQPSGTGWRASSPRTCTAPATIVG